MPSTGAAFRRAALDREIARVEQRLVARRACLARDFEAVQDGMRERLRKWRRLAGLVTLGLVVAGVAGGKPRRRAGRTPRRASLWQRASTLFAVLELGWSLFESRERGVAARPADDGQVVTAGATRTPPPSATPAT